MNRELFARVLERVRKAGPLSAEHSSLDGILMRAWSSQRSVVPKDSPPPTRGRARNPKVNCQGTKGGNETHRSYTDPGSPLATKTSKTAAIPAYTGRVITGNRHGLVINTRLTQFSRNAEHEAAMGVLAELPGDRRNTSGEANAYDTADFVEHCRAPKATPHIAQNTSGRMIRIDEHTARYPGYAASQIARKLSQAVLGVAQ